MTECVRKREREWERQAPHMNGNEERRRRCTWAKNMVFHNPISRKSIKSISRYMAPVFALSLFLFPDSLFSYTHTHTHRCEKSTHLALIIHEPFFEGDEDDESWLATREREKNRERIKLNIYIYMRVFPLFSFGAHTSSVRGPIVYFNNVSLCADVFQVKYLIAISSPIYSNLTRRRYDSKVSSYNTIRTYTDNIPKAICYARWIIIFARKVEQIYTRKKTK